MCSISFARLCTVFFVLRDASARTNGRFLGRSEHRFGMIRYQNNPSFCLSVDANRFRNGQNIQLWECEGSSGQYFRTDASNPSLLMLDADPRYCVVIDGNEHYNGANIQLWECLDLTAQKWRYENKMFRNAANDMCIVANNNQAYNGNNVQLWSCSGYEEIYMWSFGSQPSPSNPTPAPTPQPQYVNVGNGNCVGSTYPVDSASTCVEAAEALWPGQGCYGQTWASLIQAVDYPNQPQGCMLQSSAGGGCALLFNTNHLNAQATSCPAQTTCQVACVG